MSEVDNLIENSSGLVEKQQEPKGETPLAIKEKAPEFDPHAEQEKLRQEMANANARLASLALKKMSAGHLSPEEEEEYFISEKIKQTLEGRLGVHAATLGEEAHSEASVEQLSNPDFDAFLTAKRYTEASLLEVAREQGYYEAGKTLCDRYDSIPKEEKFALSIALAALIAGSVAIGGTTGLAIEGAAATTQSVMGMLGNISTLRHAEETADKFFGKLEKADMTKVDHLKRILAGIAAKKFTGLVTGGVVSGVEGFEKLAETLDSTKAASVVQSGVESLAGKAAQESVEAALAEEEEKEIVDKVGDIEENIAKEITKVGDHVEAATIATTQKTQAKLAALKQEESKPLEPASYGSE